jgi:hypothetical protein
MARGKPSSASNEQECELIAAAAAGRARLDGLVKTRRTVQDRNRWQGRQGGREDEEPAILVELRHLRRPSQLNAELRRRGRKKGSSTSACSQVRQSSDEEAKREQPFAVECRSLVLVQ